MASCDATGPCAIVWVVTVVVVLPSVPARDCLRFQQLRGVVRTQVLHDSLRDEREREDGRDGQQHPQGSAREVDPEVAERLHLLARDAADKRDGQRQAHRRRPEVMSRQPKHLGEVAHGRFGRVGLPVGVGGERDGGVPGEVRRDAGQVLRVPGQVVLQALHDVGKQQRGGAEEEHGDEVFGPAHLFVRVDAGGAIEQPLAPGRARGRARCGGARRPA